MSGGYVFATQEGQEMDGESVWTIFERVLGYPEMELQRSLVFDYDVKFAFAYRYDHGENGWTKGQRSILGMAFMPQVSGQLSDLFDQMLEDALGYRADFLIALNGPWFEQASDEQREALVFHEVKHCGQKLDKYGLPRFTREMAPMLELISHDVEEFDDVVKRYGLWKSDLRSFKAAIDSGLSRDNGAAVSDVADAFRRAAGTVEVRVVIPTTDGDLPENVNNVDPDLLEAQLDRGEVSQPQNPDDVF